MSTRHVQEDMTMDMKMIGYWATTAVVALELLAGGVTDLIHGPELLFVVIEGNRIEEDLSGQRRW
jgi:hypothetical protein